MTKRTYVAKELVKKEIKWWTVARDSVVIAVAGTLGFLTVGLMVGIPLWLLYKLFFVILP